MKKQTRKFTSAEREWLSDLDGVQGCYALHVGDICVYVGQAINLKRRLLKHLHGRKDVDNVSVYDLSKRLEGLAHQSARSLLNFEEMRLIEKLNPLENLKRPQFSWDVFCQMPFDVKRMLIDSLPLFDSSNNSA